MLSMPTITKLGTLALAVTLSISTTLAQTPVRRTAQKPSVRPYTRSTKQATPTPVRKPAVASVAQKTQAPAPVYTPPPASVETQQAAPQQSVTRTSPARPRVSMARNGRNVYLNAGVGLATYYGGGFPIGVSVEVDAKNNFSVGGSIDYYHYNYGYYSGGYNFIYAGARGSYHFPTQNKSFDPYIGATLGFRYAGYKDSSGYSYYDGYSSSYNSGLYVGIHLGARFMFSEKIGAFAELGYGVSAVKLGLAAKF